jgi:hypothetical protein
MHALTIAVLSLSAAVFAQNTPPAPGGQTPYVPGAGQPAIAQPANQPPEPAASGQPTPMQRRVEAPVADEHGLRVRIDLEVGGGNLKHNTHGAPTLQDNTDAGYFRLGGELIGHSNVGGGIRLQGIGSSDDLFVDSGGPRSQASDGEVFFHGTGLFESSGFEMPVRFGLYLRGYEIEDKTTNDKLNYGSAGIRLEVAPDLAIAGGDSVRWSIGGMFAVEFGNATVTDDPKVIGDAHSHMHGFDVGIGTKLLVHPFEFGVGWLYRRMDVAQSDTVGGSFYRAIDTEFSGLVLSMAVRF